MKNLKLSKKLLIAFGTVLTLLAVIVIAAVIGLNSITLKLRIFYNEPFQNVQAAELISSIMNEGAKNMLHACVTTDDAETADRLNQASGMFSQVDEKLSLLKSNYKGDSKDLTAIENSMQSIKTNFDELKSQCINNNIEKAFEIYQAQMLPQLGAANASVENIIKNSDSQAVSSYQEGASLGGFIILATVIAGLFSIALGIGMALYITRSLVSCVTEVRNAAQKMSNGDFDVTLTYESKDEFGELSRAMRTMTNFVKIVLEDTAMILREMAKGNFTVRTKAEEHYIGIFETLKLSMREMNRNLSDTLSQINQSADQVADSSEQVSSGSQALSQGATEQASSIEELAATINDISIHVKDTADNAMKAKSQTAAAGEEMTDCNNQMGEMIHAMSEISQKSGEIGKIIKTIEDIAFQTNILALNAAVEAARAGEAGKGFAVVADEVRNLASKSSEASKNTADLIEGTIQAVENGTNIANRTADSLIHVVETAKATSVIVDDIATSANEQAASIEQVTQGIDQISSVVQTNSATAEESAAASEELSGQAQMLKDLVGRFTLKQENIPTSLAVPSLPAEPARSSGTTVPSADKY